MGSEAVLVVDDDGDVREALVALLVGAGYDVIAAAGGDEALARLREGARPSVALVDLRMEGMDGLAFCRACRADPALAAVRLVLLSGDRTVASGSLASEAAVVLVKPVPPQRLLSTVSGLLGTDPTSS